MEEDVKAFCYLYKVNDEKNKSLLTDHNLIIIHKGKSKNFKLADIKDLGFHSRKIMLPLLSGGIFAPLSIIAIFKSLYDPWWLLFILFISLFLFYYGWLGQKVLTVTENVHHQDFALPLISPNIKAFAGFVNKTLQENISLRDKFFIYHITTNGPWSDAIRSGFYSNPSLKKEGFIHCAERNQLEQVIDNYFKGENKLLLLIIDPLKVTSEIKYEAAINEQLYPHIYGPVNTDAVVNIKSFNAEEIKTLFTSD